MLVEPYVHGEGSTTLDRIDHLIDVVEPAEILFCFAYATVSGCAEFQRRVGGAFWEAIRTRWLVGIDYGRTQPAAFDYLLGKDHASVRVFDGRAVVARAGFRPRRDFHLKACVFRNRPGSRYGLLAGSGNFSRNGLSASVECGVTLLATNVAEYQEAIRPTYRRLRALWNTATPLARILTSYRGRWRPTVIASGGPPQPDNQIDLDDFDRFWLDVGYVTRNRGSIRPGNQIDMPRGAHRFFGLTEPPNVGPNTIFGEVTFVGAGAPLDRTLRLGGNWMEKITLPFPETYPFGAYDGKILEFHRVAGGFEIEAFEEEEFGHLLQASTNRAVLQMGSGRLYGYRRA